MDDQNRFYAQSNDEHCRVQTSERKINTSKLSKAKTEAGKATLRTHTQKLVLDKEVYTLRCKFDSDKDFMFWCCNKRALNCTQNLK